MIVFYITLASLLGTALCLPWIALSSTKIQAKVDRLNAQLESKREQRL